MPVTVAALHAHILSERQNIIVPRLYLELLDGDYVAAIVFKEIVFWSGDWAATPDRDGWFYRTAPAWKADHYLSWSQVARAVTKINTLIDPRPNPDDPKDPIPLVQKKTRKIRATNGTVLNETAMHFRLDQDLYADLIVATMEAGRPDSWNSTKFNSGNPTKFNSGNSTKSKSLTDAPETYTGDSTGGEAPPAPAAAAVRIPDDFQLTPDDLAWAHAKGFTDDEIGHYGEAFENHWRAEAGPKAKKIDWHAAFRTWMSRETPGRRQPRQGTQPMTGDQLYTAFLERQKERER
jgi:hypothetical protein